MLNLKAPDTAMLTTAPGITAGQWGQEFAALLHEYIDLAPESVLEIGTWQGGTLYHWLQNAKPGTTVISMDKGPTNWRPAQPDFDVTVWREWAAAGVETRIILGDSHEQEALDAVRKVAPDGLDFLFIDGDHSYKGAKLDWEMYGPLVREGGIVAFHDLITPAGQQHIEIRRLWREIQRAGYKTRELYSHPGQEWGGIGVVYV